MRQASARNAPGGVLKHAVTVKGTFLFCIWLFRVSSNSMGELAEPGPHLLEYTRMFRSM